MIDRLSVKARLTWAFGILTCFVLFVSALSLYALGESNARFERFVKGVNARTQLAEDVRSAVDRRAIAIRNLVLVTKPEDLAVEKEALLKASSDVRDELARSLAGQQAKDAAPQGRKLVEGFAAIEKSYALIAQDIYQLILDGKRDEAIARMNDDCRPHFAALTQAINAYIDFNHKRAETALALAAKSYLEQQALLLGACLAAIVAAGLAGFAIVRNLTRALGAEPAALNAAARRVAQGNLGPVAGADHAPADSVLANLGAMQRGLAAVVSQVLNASDSIATGSAEIATGNADLSQRTEQQAANLQQTSASMQQLNGTVQSNADVARQACRLATTASESAARGGTVVNDVVATMEEISTSSRRIGDIIGVIDGIAFQTNILALNAAVEAARAGEQGRGFAVVAGEVRTLAIRSADAAREIKSLIGASVDKVEAGTRLAGHAGAAMQDIVAQVNRVTDLIGEIGSATAEQTTGLGQVSQAVSQLDQVTQQNAALVEQSAAAAESLKQQARQLAQAVGMFKLAQT